MKKLSENKKYVITWNECILPNIGNAIQQEIQSIQ